MQLQQVRQQTDHGEQKHPEHQLHGLGTPDEQEEPIQKEGHQADIDQIEDMAPDGAALEEHENVAQDDVHRRSLVSSNCAGPTGTAPD